MQPVVNDSLALLLLFPVPGFPDVDHQWTRSLRDVAPARVIGRCELLAGTWAATSATAIVLLLDRFSMSLSSPLRG